MPVRWRRPATRPPFPREARLLPTTLLLCLGIGLLLGGGRTLVRGASDLATASGIPPIVIGLTVIAFGTSAPELAVNLTGALTGQDEISFGNIVGSNIANIGLILGVAACVSPLQITSRVIVREIPMMLLATAAFAVMALDAVLRRGTGVFDRADALLLLLFFSVFIYATWLTVRRRKTDSLLVRSVKDVEGRPAPAVWLSLLRIGGGLAALIFGGDLTVENAVRLGEALGVPPAAIGFSVVAIGTSLPELVTSVVAARMGETDIAVGNVVGSNIFNLLFIMGITATVRPVSVPPGGLSDLGALVVASLILLPLSVTNRGRIVRAEGIVLIVLWLGYTGWRLLAGP